MEKILKTILQYLEIKRLYREMQRLNKDIAALNVHKDDLRDRARILNSRIEKYNETYKTNIKTLNNIH